MYNGRNRPTKKRTLSPWQSLLVSVVVAGALAAWIIAELAPVRALQLSWRGLFGGVVIAAGIAFLIALVMKLRRDRSGSGR
ncbi:hypothetical protein [Actinomadura geliboluensis]|uniref:Uncharacterized protein n=1 Tax=Actinomadura geliboluensis TaxID=882440 RepID=A0A5S4HCL0_9ACTN|nr:hypothetical protein [Actinomadura geliboluensis]TMR42474.1 hypothetical protein ETD96_00235 [Actinomadura geliboluensis]